MSIFRKSPTAVPPTMVDLTKKAAVSLDKHGLTGLRAAVYLVLDHSGSMAGFYADGSVQRLAEQTLALSANLDDDGVVPVVFFHTYVEHTVDVSLANYQGVIEREHTRTGWGSTDYIPAMSSVVGHYQASGATDPALVVFQTDGGPDDPGAVEIALRSYSKLPIFWATVGFGHSIRFLENLDTLGGRAVDNASFFHAERPHQVSDEALFDGITGEFAQWLTAARSAGIIR